jgi:hypothetical protein
MIGPDDISCVHGTNERISIDSLPTPLPLWEEPVQLERLTKLEEMFGSAYVRPLTASP